MAVKAAPRLLLYPVPDLQVTSEKSSVTEPLLTLLTDQRLLCRRSLDEVRLVVKLVVSQEMLFLSECLITLLAAEGLEPCVLEIVSLQVLVDRGPVVTLRALQVLLSSVRPLVDLKAVSVSKLLPTLAGVVPVISAVQLLHVELQVNLPAERAVTKLTGDDVLLLGVDLRMDLQRVTLIKGLGTESTLVWLLA